MKSTLLACFVLLAALSVRAADAPAADPAAAITGLLQDFLAHTTDPARHMNFWADDLVYTGYTGVVRNKAEVVQKVMEEAAKGKPAEPAFTITPEDINVRSYDGFAALTFRSVIRSGGEVESFRHSGTLIFREGRWQVVTWQTTKIQPAEKK